MLAQQSKGPADDLTIFRRRSHHISRRLARGRTRGRFHRRFTGMARTRRTRPRRPWGMNALVVDTDIVSFLFKGHPAASLYKADLTGQAHVISFMTLAELERWPIQARWGEEKRQLLRDYVKPFVVMPRDRALCRAWAEVMVGARARGFRIDCADAWVAPRSFGHS
jgi:predicted nucleic acid-binding protein